MRRKFLCGLAASCWTSGLTAQPVPARDLWEFPLGALLEPAALASEPGAGFWNPAAMAVPAADRWRFGMAALSSASAQSIDAQFVSATRRGSGTGTVGVTIARAAVAGIVRTDADPQAIGDVPYGSTLVSVGAARDLLPHVRAGIAARWRHGRSDADRRRAVAADMGLIVHGIPWRDARVALSSFLWRPGREVEDRAVVVAATDLRLARGSLGELRFGGSYSAMRDGPVERGPIATGRIGPFEAHGAWLRTVRSGQSASRLRTGVAMRYARYVVGVAREEGIAGLGPLYQFSLSSGVP